MTRKQVQDLVIERLLSDNKLAHAYDSSPAHGMGQVMFVSRLDKICNFIRKMISCYLAGSSPMGHGITNGTNERIRRIEFLEKKIGSFLFFSFLKVYSSYSSIRFIRNPMFHSR